MMKRITEWKETWTYILQFWKIENLTTGEFKKLTIRKISKSSCDGFLAVEGNSQYPIKAAIFDVLLFINMSL